MTAQVRPMSNLQLELLQMYATNIPDRLLMDIKKMLAEYFAALIDKEMSEVWEEKEWGDETIEGWKTERLRVPY